MFKQIFRTLKSIRKGLANRLLNNPRPSESDQSPWLGNIQIAKHGKTRCHASGGRIGQY